MYDLLLFTALALVNKVLAYFKKSRLLIINHFKNAYKKLKINDWLKLSSVVIRLQNLVKYINNLN